MKVAVVCNNARCGVISRFGPPNLEASTDDAVPIVADALRDEGHTVAVFEGDKHLLGALERYMPPTGDGDPRGFVFNLARGIQGECAHSHVPAMLELAGIPYTGPAPLGHALTSDIVAVRTLLERAGIPTPRYTVMRAPGLEAAGLRYPLQVGPRRERPGFGARVARSPEQLAAAVEHVITACQQEALVEEHVEGAGLIAALLGNGDIVEVLPLVERGADGAPREALDRERASRFRSQVEAVAVTAFNACCCQDYAIVDISINRAGCPQVARLDSMPRLSRHSLFVHAAVAGGYGQAELLTRILDVAHERYFGVGAPRFEIPAWQRPGIPA